MKFILRRDILFIASVIWSAKSYVRKSYEEIKMLLPIKFLAASIFVSGMTAGAVCGAVVGYTFSSPERVNRLKDYVKKVSEACKK